MTSIFKRFVKPEPVVVNSEPMPFDESDEQSEFAPPPPMRAPTARALADDDDDIDDKRPMTPTSRTTVSSLVARANTGENRVQHVSLKPTSASVGVVSSTELMPQQNRLLSLDEYNEPPQLATMSRANGAAYSDSAHSASNMVNYLVARTEAGGLPVDRVLAGGSDYANAYLRRYFQAPPQRTLPCSASSAARLHASTTAISFAHFAELCSTARPNEPACSRGFACEAIGIENEYGQPINNVPFVAIWYKTERVHETSGDKEAFASEWKNRMCVYCEACVGLRAKVNSQTTNSGVNPSQKVQLAVGWHVLVNLSGEFYQSDTIGPDPQCFNGLVANIPRICKRGWKVKESLETNRVQFIPPYARYPSDVDAATRDATRGF